MKNSIVSLFEVLPLIGLCIFCIFYDLPGSSLAQPSSNSNITTLNYSDISSINSIYNIYQNLSRTPGSNITFMPLYNSTLNMSAIVTGPCHVGPNDVVPPPLAKRAACAIYKKANALNLGFSISPTSEVIASTDRLGFYQHFDGGAGGPLTIFWSAASGANEVHGSIRELYLSIGSELSCLGYPVSDEENTLEGSGRYNLFQHGYVYWTWDGGAHDVCTSSLPSTPQQMVDSSTASDRGCSWPGVFPQWVSVQPEDNQMVAAGTVTRSFVSFHDIPWNHNSHDGIFYVNLDPAYSGLYSTAHKVVDNVPIMEMEWEIGSTNFGPTDRFPIQFWPEQGDRVWMMGRWVFDCGHEPYPTELHPVSAVAFTRNQPTIFEGDSSPTMTSKTFLYLGGEGGYYNTPVGGRDYYFDVILPASLTDTARLTAEIQYPLGNNGPSPLLVPFMISFPLPVGNPPIFIVLHAMHIIYPLSTIGASPQNQFGAIISAGWREPVLTQGYKLLRVTFDSITINKDHDPSFSGEWQHLWAGVNGHWIELSGPSGYFDLDEADDGDTKHFQDRSVMLLVPDNGNVRIHTTGWETDEIDEHFGFIPVPQDLDDNEPIGIIDRVYPVSDPNTYIPKDPRSTPDPEGGPETDSDFILRFHIDEIASYRFQ
jgi:hypothetical protein